MVLTRSLAVIAEEINSEWRNVNYAAKPYLEAMAGLTEVTDYCGQDDAASIVLRFLGNARSWRGPVAKRVKAELRDMVTRH